MLACPLRSSNAAGTAPTPRPRVRAPSVLVEGQAVVFRRSKVCFRGVGFCGAEVEFRHTVRVDPVHVAPQRHLVRSGVLSIPARFIYLFFSNPEALIRLVINVLSQTAKKGLFFSSNEANIVTHVRALSRTISPKTEKFIYPTQNKGWPCMLKKTVFSRSERFLFSIYRRVLSVPNPFVCDVSNCSTNAQRETHSTRGRRSRVRFVSFVEKKMRTSCTQGGTTTL